MKNTKIILTAIAAYFTVNFASAHGGHGGSGEPNLHVNPRWRECSFQLDKSLTQDEWHRFAREAAMVIYYRPLIDAKPLGKGQFEFSVMQWNTKIDESAGAWNNTFVHPDSVHWLIGGEELPFPGLSLRAGVSRKVDVGVYWTVRPGANYGLAGAQVQYNIINDTLKNWALSTRFGFNSLYGPEDMNFATCGLDVVASKKFPIIDNKLSLSPYAGVSSYLSYAHEKSEVVNLEDEDIAASQAMVGTTVQVYFATLGVEYNFADINTFSYKLGARFKF